MATKDKILSNYPSVTDAAEGSLLYLVIPNVSSATGYTAKKITATDLAKSILNDYTFTNLLDTTAKNVFGAINELASGTYDVSDLGDVELTSLTGGQILMYDSESSKWVNYSLDTSVSADEVSYNNSASGLQATDLQNAVDEVASSLGSTSLAGLNDVNITSATADQVLKYDSTSSKWVNGNASNSVSSLTDTTISNPSNGQVLTYDSNSSKWINTNSSSNVEYFDIEIDYNDSTKVYNITTTPASAWAAYEAGKKFRVIINDPGTYPNSLKVTRSREYNDNDDENMYFMPIEVSRCWKSDYIDPDYPTEISSVVTFLFDTIITDSQADLKNDSSSNDSSRNDLYCSFFRSGYFVLDCYLIDGAIDDVSWRTFENKEVNTGTTIGTGTASINFSQGQKTTYVLTQTLAKNATQLVFPASNKGWPSGEYFWRTTHGFIKIYGTHKINLIDISEAVYNNQLGNDSGWQITLTFEPNTSQAVDIYFTIEYPYHV